MAHFSGLNLVVADLRDHAVIARVRDLLMLQAVNETSQLQWPPGKPFN